jgi:short-subunit dehydrogenase
MGLKLAGAHILITGANRGIGRALADEFARREARLSLVVRGEESAKSVAGLEANTIVADLGNMDQVDTVVPAARRAHGPVEVLINNAAVNLPGPLGTYGQAELRDRLTCNFTAPMELMRAALQDMLPARSGRIVNISSLVGDMAVRNVIPYSASKAGLGLATRALRRELNGTGVLAQLVVLGAVDTQMMMTDTYSDPVAAQSAARLGRIRPQTPEQAAQAITAFTERGSEVLVLPRVGGLVHGLRFLPTRMADLILAGIPRSH